MEIVRREQRLRVSTERTVAERVRLIRRVVTETRVIPVEVRREVLEVVHLPVDPGDDDNGINENDDGNGGDDAAGRDVRLPLEMVLHEEVPVVSVRVRPVERVTVTVSSVTSATTVTAELATEQVEITSEHVTGGADSS